MGDCRFDHSVQAFTVRRVEDNGIHTLGDQALKICDLLGRAAIAIDDDDSIDKPAHRSLGLDGADHLFAPSVANEGIAHADNKSAFLHHSIVVSGHGRIATRGWRRSAGTKDKQQCQQ